MSSSSIHFHPLPVAFYNAGLVCHTTAAVTRREEKEYDQQAVKQLFSLYLQHPDPGLFGVLVEDSK